MINASIKSCCNEDENFTEKFIFTTSLLPNQIGCGTKSFQEHINESKEEVKEEENEY